MQVTVLAYHHADARIARQIRFLKRRSTVMTASAAVEALNSGTRVPRRIAVLTFDDGYEEVHRWLLPALREEHASASVYVPGRILSDPRPFWWDAVEIMIARSEARELAWKGVRYDLADLATRAGLAGKINSALTREPASRIDLALNELEHALHPRSDPIPARYRVMDKTQLRDLAAAGVELGSHTMTHQCLTSLPDCQIKEELRASKTLLENELATDVSGLAYPFGGSDYFNPAVCAIARDAGYQYAFTTLPGSNLSAQPRFELRRYFVSTADGAPVLWAMITGLWSRWMTVRNVRNRLVSRLKRSAASGAAVASVR